MNFNLKSLAMAGTCAATLLAGSELMAWGESSRPNIFGGYDYYSNGTRTGSSRSNIFGGYDYYRGMSSDITPDQLAKKLFADEDFATRIDVIAIQDAIYARNVDAMTSCAWDLKGVELILGKKDKTTTSDMIFASAANLAVEQGNAEALKQIIALAPECKKYEEQLALRGKTRGLNKSVTAFPQLVVLQGKDWQKTITSLSAWEQPALDQYICASFRGMTKESAVTASMLVNEGRLTMNPMMIAIGALELAKYPYDSKLGIKFEPAQIFAEAAELAIAKQDADALKQLVALYGTTNFKTAEFAKYMQDELAMLGNTRGLKMDDAKFKPGDFSPLNFDKLVRTVYCEMPEINNI